jgi:hypothetical protein
MSYDVAPPRKLEGSVVDTSARHPCAKCPAVTTRLSGVQVRAGWLCRRCYITRRIASLPQEPQVLKRDSAGKFVS